MIMILDMSTILFYSTWFRVVSRCPADQNVLNIWDSDEADTQYTDRIKIALDDSGGGAVITPGVYRQGPKGAFIALKQAAASSCINKWYKYSRWELIGIYCHLQEMPRSLAVLVPKACS